MNFTESFNDFSSRLGPMDLALYAVAGLILWVLFKDKLSPVQKLLTGLLDKVTKKTNTENYKSPIEDSLVKNNSSTDLFLDMIVSWKKTRDLAVRANCTEAVKSIDGVFPNLSPNACNKGE